MIVSALIALIGLIAFASSDYCPQSESIDGCECRLSESEVIVTCSVPLLLKTAVKGFSEPQPTTIDEMTISGLLREGLEAAFLDKAIVKKLIIRDNVLTSATIDRDAFRLQERSLQELTFECEKLDAIPFEALKYLIMLKKLGITKSKALTVLTAPPNDMPELPISIEELGIYGNSKLVTIPAKCFEKFPNLKVLKLSENAIVEMPSNLLKENNQVKRIELESNNMTKIPLDLLKVLSSYSAVFLGYNMGIVNVTGEDMATIVTRKLVVMLDKLKIYCGCPFKTVALMNEFDTGSNIYGRCASPKALSGTKFSSLRTVNFTDCPATYYFHDSQLIGNKISLFA